jgi:hypothetical protein
LGRAAKFFVAVYAEEQGPPRLSARRERWGLPSQRSDIHQVVCEFG